MKHFFNFTAVVIITIMMIGCTKSNGYVVTGKDTTGRCPNGEWAYLCIQKDNPEDFHYIDSVKIENNGFQFEGKIENPTIAHIMTRAYNDSLRFNKPIIVHDFILESGNIETDCQDDMHTPSGTPLNDKITSFYTEIATLLESLEEEDLSEEEIINKAFEFTKNKIKENADNEFGVFVAELMYGEFSPKQHLEMFNLLSNKQEYFKEQIIESEKATEITVNMPYADVCEPTIEGQNISLKSIVEKQGNKYVLLEFWASWCGPCMYEMPNLKATYEKYHNKGFEVYASSLDVNKKDWQNAINKIGMPWINVCGMKAGESPAPDKYAVLAIPANFLIDCATGKIIATQLRGEEVEKKMEELLK